MLLKELPDLEGVEMNSEHGVDVDELINTYNEQYEQFRAVSLLFNHQVVKISELEKKINDLQCCGNCKYFMYCKTDGLIYCEIEVFPFPIKGMCNQWQSDGLTKEERIKG
jgi:hypothetical protein